MAITIHTSLTNHTYNIEQWLPDYSITNMYIYGSVDGSDSSETLPDNFFDGYKDLQMILFQNIRIDKLPTSFEKLTSLKSVSMIACKLKQIPLEITKLRLLECLHLCCNKLTSVRPELCQLQNLTDLNLYSNDLVDIRNIFTLPNLRFLGLQHNCLKTIPDLFQHTPLLLEIRVYNNSITHLPPSICTLRNLKKLYIYSNELIELPDNLGDLTNLIGLSFQNNQISELPPTLPRCRNLKSLDWHNNPIRYIPPNVERLIERLLHFNNNHISKKTTYKNSQSTHTSSIQRSVIDSIYNLLKD